MKGATRTVRTLALALCVLLCCALAGCGAPETAASPFSALSFSLEINDAREPISCFWQGDGSCVVFLPSCARMDGLSVNLPKKTDATLGGTALTDGMTCGAFRIGTDYELAFGNETASLRFVQAENVPALYVHTQSGDMEFVHAQKTNKEPARLLLVTADGEVAYESTGMDSIRGRGNSTWSKAKKPYNLYLRQSADLLGMGEANDWVLLANAFDETNLRNRVVFDFAKRVTGDPRIAPDTAFTDVWLNGEYAGLYLLTEKVQIAENRLDIDPDSMLFSWVKTARNDSFFALNSTSSVEIESPKKISAERQKELQTYLLSWQDALSSDGEWQKYIDVESFVHKYLIEEAFLNSDLYNSQYFYIEPNGKMTAGPCWDYDLTLGVCWRNTWSTPNCFSAQNKLDENETWYSELWKKDAFRARALELFRTQYLPLLTELADGGIEREAQAIAASSGMNALRWNELFGGRTSEQAVTEMTQFFKRRIAFLRSAWIDGTQYCTLTLRHPVKYEYISVPPGTVCTEFPQPQGLDLPGKTVWLRADTGEPFDPQSVIDEDVTLVLPRQPKPISRRTILMIGAITAMAAMVVATVLLDWLRRRKKRK